MNFDELESQIEGTIYDGCYDEYINHPDKRFASNALVRESICILEDSINISRNEILKACAALFLALEIGVSE